MILWRLFAYLTIAALLGFLAVVNTAQAQTVTAPGVPTVVTVTLRVDLAITEP